LFSDEEFKSIYKNIKEFSSLNSELQRLDESSHIVKTLPSSPLQDLTIDAAQAYLNSLIRPKEGINQSSHSEESSSLVLSSGHTSLVPERVRDAQLISHLIIRHNVSFIELIDLKCLLGTKEALNDCWVVLKSLKENSVVVSAQTFNEALKLVLKCNAMDIVLWKDRLLQRKLFSLRFI
jgi:hypothetical protein